MLYTCMQCQQSFEDEIILLCHYELIHNVNPEVGIPSQSTRPSVIKFAPAQKQPIVLELIAEGLRKSQVRHYEIKNRNQHDLSTFFDEILTVIVEKLKEELKRLNFVKFGLILDAQFVNIHDEMTNRSFICRNRTLMHSSDINAVVLECLQELILKLTESEGYGSGWMLIGVNLIKIRVHKIGIGNRGSSYIPLPKKVSQTKACVNVKNFDNQCFKYAMLSKFIKKNSTRPGKHYEKVANKYNFTGLSYPVAVSDIVKFEKKNLSVSINVYGLEGNNIYPIKVCSAEKHDHTDLILFSRGKNWHYVNIKDFNSLVANQLTKTKRRLSVCKRCLCFSSNGLNKQWLHDHMLLCKNQSAVKIIMPPVNKSEVRFTAIKNQYKIPIVIYADFEACLQPIEVSQLESNSQRKYQQHIPNSYCILVKSTLSKDHLQMFSLSNEPQIYRGDNAAEHFVQELYKIIENVSRLYNHIVPMDCLTDEQETEYISSQTCYICNHVFTPDNPKVRDHDHLTGKFRGSSCNNCNLNYKLPNFVPVILHNLSCYDAHFIVPELGRRPGRIDVLATTSQRFISFSKTIGKLKLRFIDSFKFLPSSLLKLAENLLPENFIETGNIVPDDKLNLVLRKGVFCYDYIDGFDRFLDTCLPPRHKFFNTLLNEDISSEDYDHACKVWNELGMKTLGDYSDFYVTLDCTLLCDIMERFRNACMEAYGLDPLHSYTSPGFSWQAMLKMTNCRLQLLTDINMLLMVESGVRGGLTQSVTRHVKANNKYMPEYDPQKESIYLGYFDANNLYGWAMSKPLPYGDFVWVDAHTITDVMSIPKYGPVGYIMEVDFDYPHRLHDQHFDLPLLPRTEIPPDGKYSKLLATLNNKERYVAHLWIIQQAIELGLKLTKIHRVLKFSQSNWLKPYIDYNTSRRSNCSSPFEKDFYKLMNNSIFGKSLENKRRHKDIKLVCDEKKLENLVRKPNFRTSIIINENLVAVCMNKTRIKMDRPFYVGMCILDISKTLLYDFHYNKMVSYYGRSNIGISYMDTDSYLYSIKTQDMYEDLKNFVYKDEFDFSDYPKQHKNFNNKNKKVLGKFKDEANGVILQEIVALMSKMYSIKLQNDENKEIKKAKGIKSYYLKKNLSYDDYKKCLFDRVTYTASYNVIRSYNHNLFSITETKKALSAHDDKRVILQDGVHTLPYGHYSLANICE